MKTQQVAPEPRGILRRLGTIVPNALVLGALLGALYWGHKTHWSFGAKHADAATGADELASTAGASPIHRLEPAGEDEAGAPTMAQAVEFSSQEEAQKAGLLLGKAEVRPMDEYVTANGIVTYDQDHLAQLSTRVSGIVWRVEKQVGDVVKKGELLAILDSVEVGRAKADFLQSMVHYDLSRKNLERLRSIAASVPERMVREAEANVREDRVRRFNAQQTLVNLGLPIDIEEGEKLSDEELASRIHFLGLPTAVAESFDRATTTANLIPLIAPFDGVVISRDIVVGEVVDPTKPHFTIADVRKMWLLINVDREDAPLLDIGQEVVFYADGMPREVTSRVSWIATEVDRKTRTVQIRAEAENPSLDDGPDASEGQRLLRANMFGTGRIQIKFRPDAVAVPGNAVQTSGSRRVVFLPRNDFTVFVPREVRTGVSSGGFTEVLEGLAPGDEVVTTGSYMLKSELFGNEGD